jgi:hypothetical protein
MFLDDTLYKKYNLFSTLYLFINHMLYHIFFQLTVLNLDMHQSQLNGYPVVTRGGNYRYVIK